MTDGTTDNNDDNMIFGDPHQPTGDTGDNGPVMGDTPAQDTPAQDAPAPAAPVEEAPAADTTPVQGGVPTPVENSTPEDETTAPSGDTSDTL